MKKDVYTLRFLRYIIAIVSITMIMACSSKQQPEVQTIIETHTVKDPGSVEYVWEPPMVDVVNVPPGLDPEGHYYRPSHEEVVEIRQGRWKYKKPVDKRNIK